MINDKVNDSWLYNHSSPEKVPTKWRRQLLGVQCAVSWWECRLITPTLFLSHRCSQWYRVYYVDLHCSMQKIFLSCSVIIFLKHLLLTPWPQQKNIFVGRSGFEIPPQKNSGSTLSTNTEESEKVVLFNVWTEMYYPSLRVVGKNWICTPVRLW